MTTTMTNKTTAALKLAEEAMTSNMRLLGAKAIAAIREALAEQEKQEPVAWGCIIDDELVDFVPTEQKDINGNKGNYETPLYAAPVSAKREWADLTDYEIEELLFNRVSNDPLNEYARAVIAAFKEKNK